MVHQSQKEPGSKELQVRKRPALFRALGDGNPPEKVTVMDRQASFVTLLKHDSWAATAIYRFADDQLIICKFNRTQPVFGIPMGWLGRILANREARFLRKLDHIAFIPDDFGPVKVGSRTLKTAVARAYIKGVPFGGGSAVDAMFFERLRNLLNAVHAARMAYVDLHKRENIIIDTEDQPHLIDFQVSVGLTQPRIGGMRQKLIRMLQEMDNYHFRKHQARCLHPEFSAEAFERFVSPPAFIRAHRVVAVPLRKLRRRLLTLLRVRDDSGQARSELEAEDAFRDRNHSRQA